MSSRINISIEFNGQQADYRIPADVTMGRFVELMHELFKPMTSLPENWTLKLKNKDIKVVETDLIKDLPIADWDLFCVIPLKEKKEQMNESI
ncbi:EsaB/YukD family protein [Lactovum odontotermitis]